VTAEGLRDPSAGLATATKAVTAEGLRVDLYGATPTQPVRVLITANPARGVLGQVFCRLASGQAAGG
jgi:hypothetical protein